MAIFQLPGSQFLLHGFGHCIDALEDDFGCGRIWNLETEILVESDDELEGINGIET